MNLLGESTNLLKRVINAKPAESTEDTWDLFVELADEGMVEAITTKSIAVMIEILRGIEGPPKDGEWI